MSDIANKLAYLVETKANLRSAIASKGVEVSEDTPFRDYAPLISGISAGAELNIAYSATAPEDTGKLWVAVDGAKSEVILSEHSGGSASLSALEARLPTPLFFILAFSVGTKVYGCSRDRCIVFDTATNNTVSYSFDGSYVAAAAIGTNIYLFGDTKQTNCTRIVKFNIETGVIERIKCTLPEKLLAFSASAVGSKIYLFGGTSLDTYKPVSTIVVFDSETKTVRTVSATLPNAMDSCTSITVGSKIYLFGGRSSPVLYNDIVIFDTLSETVTTSQTKVAQYGVNMGCASIGKTVYLFGGYRGGATWTNFIQSFDTESEVMAELQITLPVCAGNVGAAAMNGLIYLMGGIDGNDNLDTIYRFYPSLSPNQLLLTPNRNGPNLTIAHCGGVTLRAGIGSVYTGDENGTLTKVPAYLYTNGSWTEL